MLSDDRVAELARTLWDAEVACRPLPSLRRTAEPPGREDAYRVQRAVTTLRLAAGQRIVGRKIGLTSTAMQQMSGVTEPDYGNLFDTMRLDSPALLPHASLIQPMVEPELGFVLGADLRGPGVGADDVLRACAYVTPVLEIVDSRIRGWDIDWVDTVADNASSGAFVVAPGGVSPLDLDMEVLGVTLRRDDELAATATMAEVLGDPVRAVAWLVNKLGTHGEHIAAGEIVLAGSPCRAIPLAAGDRVDARMTGLPPVSVRAVSA